jgi:hypothetical protein
MTYTVACAGICGVLRRTVCGSVNAGFHPDLYKKPGLFHVLTFRPTRVSARWTEAP